MNNINNLLLLCRIHGKTWKTKRGMKTSASRQRRVDLLCNMISFSDYVTSVEKRPQFPAQFSRHYFATCQTPSTATGPPSSLRLRGKRYQPRLNLQRGLVPTSHIIIKSIVLLVQACNLGQGRLLCCVCLCGPC